MLLVEKLVNFVMLHRKLVIAVNLIICALLMVGVAKLEVSSSYKRFVSPDSAFIASIYDIEASYSENNNILVMFKPDNGDVFNEQTLLAIQEFTEKAWRLPYAKRVDSLTNFQYTHVNGDELIVDDLVGDIEGISSQELQQLKRRALSQIEIVNFLVAENGGAAGINIDFDVNDDETLQLHEAVLATKNLIAETEKNYPNVKGYSTGLVSLLYGWIEAAALDIAFIVPVAMVTIFMGMIWFFGSISATVVTLLISCLSIFCALGVLGHSGGFLVSLTSSGVIMILILAVADSVHVLSTIGKFIENGESKKDAITQSVVINFRAIALTSITTAIGFLSFNFSQFDGIKSLGNLVAVGILFAFVFSVILLPVILSYCKLKGSKNRIKKERYIQLANFVLRHRKLLLLATGPVVLLSIWLAQQNELDDGMADFISDRMQIRIDMKEIENSLTGSASLLYNFDTNIPGKVNDPEYMHQVDALVAWFRQQEGIRHVSSYTDTMRRLNRDMNYGDESFNVLPNDQELAAQYLLLYEMSLPFGQDLTNQINLDKSGSLLRVTTNNMSLTEFSRLNAKTKSWMQHNTPDIVQDASGAVYIMSLIIGKNFMEMLEGAVLALAIIGIILMLSLRSFLASVVCIVGIVGPILVAFAAWALTVGSVGLAAATVISMVTGITVDDSVHFMSKYLHARKNDGQSREDAIRYAYENVGEALLINTVALGAGFLILTLSHLSIYSVMGLLTAITIVLALLVNISLVPALLMVRFNKEKRFFLEF